jgi:hypothetical protein
LLAKIGGSAFKARGGFEVSFLLAKVLREQIISPAKMVETIGRELGRLFCKLRTDASMLDHLTPVQRREKARKYFQVLGCGFLRAPSQPDVSLARSEDKAKLEHRKNRKSRNN